MKKCLLFFMFLIVSTFVFAQSKTMYVNVKSAELKNGTGFFSKKVAVLEYGQPVTAISSGKKWTQVKAGNTQGWIYTASLTTRKITSSSKNFSASTDELALAGKGFNAEIESEYKKSGKVNYAAVDKIEAFSVSESELLEFVKSGNLNGGEE